MGRLTATVAPGPEWGVTPRRSIEAACARRGRDDVVDGCVALLAGGIADPALVYALGGPGSTAVLDGGLGGVNAYWLRVWGARGLLWAWDARAVPVLLDAFDDEAWRVREMAAKVATRHRVTEAAAALARLRGDPVERVRVAAAKADGRPARRPPSDGGARAH